MINITLSMLNIKTNKETAMGLNMVFINTEPDFQREYEAWDDKLKTKFVETMLLGRAMNPIWTILNPLENSEEILDGMHRVRTATDFLNNKFQLSGTHLCNEYKKYHKKYFDDLDPDDKARIRNYNFIFNNLDSSYRTDINKRKDMYEILNRSSKTLNQYEFNKVLYNPFYELIIPYKEKFNKFFDKKDERGQIETEIITCIILSNELGSKSWNSLTNLQENYLNYTIGKTEEKVNIFLENNREDINNKLDFMSKIINRFTDDNIISRDFKTFKRLFIPYQFIISRLCFKLNDISTFNRHIKNIMESIKNEIFDTDIQAILKCKTRNAKFQKDLITKIDEIIDSHYNKKDEARFFNKTTVNKKLLEQGNKCNICNKDLSNKNYEADHILPWCNGGKTEYSNLQVLCKPCHQTKC